MQRVRVYEPRDRERVRHICLETAGESFKKDPERLYALYCDYYIEREPEHCFVLTNDKDEAVGYVISAFDYERYYRDFKRYYMPKLSFGAALERRAEHLLTRRLTRQYPAHLHIDILPDCCGSGGGRALIRALTDALKKENVSGLMLITDPSNTRARRFFSACGFKNERDAVYVMSL